MFMGESRSDEHVVRLGQHRTFGLLGTFSSSLTLAWLASHRDRLKTLLLGGKRLSVLIIWDREGAKLVERDDDEVEALRRVVYGPEPS